MNRVNKIIALTFFKYSGKMLFSLFILKYRLRAHGARYTGNESIDGFYSLSANISTSSDKFLRANFPSVSKEN